MTDKFNFEKLYELLYTASKNAFTSIQHAHEHESFYMFSLYTCGSFGYILPTSNTEEGLTLAAKKYSALKTYQSFSIEQLREHLRWSPCDSPLHLEGENHFFELNKFISKVPLLLDEIPTDLSWSVFDDFVNKFMGVFIKVLTQLDTEGVFGEGDKRNKVVLNILMGDQSDEERLKYAKILNPPSVYNHFERVYHP